MVCVSFPRAIGKAAVIAISLLCLPPSETFAAPQTASEKIQIIVPGMCCNGCAQKVAAQLYAAPGVSNVEADVAGRNVTVTFKPSPKLTLGQLWQAAEKADGKPSKLVTSRGTYTLQRPEELKLNAPLSPGRYWVVVSRLTTSESAQEISKRLQGIRSVQSVSFDAANHTFFVESANAEPLSPWNLMTAVEQSGQSADSVTGPYGVLTLEKPTATAVRTNQPQQQGPVR